MATTPRTDEACFRAMGSDAHVIVVDGPPSLLRLAQARIEALEARWSRFRPDSEVSLLNQRAGAWVVLSPDTKLLVERATEAWRLTGGRFDPTVLGDVLRAGYDRSFEQLAALPPTEVRDGSTVLLGCSDIDVHGHQVRLPAGTGFDPGGIGKGLAADLVVADLLEAGAAGACVNLGGDVRVAGVGPAAAAGWTVGVDHPWSTPPLTRIGIHQGAVATSTTLRRRWDVDGEARHHLIDPGTGRPSETDLTSVTVVAGKAWMAEVLAKAVLLRGSQHPFDVVDGCGAEAFAVHEDGSVLGSDRIHAFLGGHDLPSHIDPPTTALATPAHLGGARP